MIKLHNLTNQSRFRTAATTLLLAIVHFNVW